MSHAVWQYELKATTRQEIEMPFGAKILKLAVHDDKPCLWVLVNLPTATSGVSYREIRLYTTDEPIEDADRLQYIGSIGSEATVLHCFEAVRVII